LVPIEAIGKLRTLGYSIFLEDEGLRYRYSGEGVPDVTKAMPLLHELSARKEEVKEVLKREVESFSESYELLLQEINSHYIPGAIDFAKKHKPEIWSQILATEDRLGAIWLAGGKMTDFKEALSLLRGLYLKVIEIFKSDVPM
jgi:hypothetical protein